MDDLPLAKGDAPCGLGGGGGSATDWGAWLVISSPKPPSCDHNKQGCGCAMDGRSWEVCLQTKVLLQEMKRDRTPDRQLLLSSSFR